MAAKAAKGSRGGAAEGPYPPLVLVVGSDPFLVDEAAGEALDELSPGWREDEFKVTRVAGAVDRVDDALAALRQVREAILQPGFFAAETVVWLRGVSFSGTDRTSRSDDVRAALDDWRTELRENGLPAGVSLVVSGTGIAKNSVLFNGFAAMAKEGRARVVDAAGGSSTAVQKRAAAALEKNGWTMSAPVLAAFVRRVGTDVGTAMRELEKLFAYTGGAEPTAADVAEICTVCTDGEIWEIQDVFGRRDLAGTLATVAKLLSNKGVKEIALLIMLETRLLDLALLADARERGLLAPDGRSWSPALGPADRAAVEALGKADVLARPSFLRGSIVEQSRLWSGAQVRAARVALMHAHERLVGSGSAEDRAILETAICTALA